MTTEKGKDLNVDIYVKEGRAPRKTVSYNHDEEVVGVPSEHQQLVRNDTGLVGLANQGATCYLNSLLQSLYMTHDFITALFAWRFDSRVHGAAEFCIPFQLQLLFARLTVSERTCVGTKDLTHSFRWTQAESFRQHDIQELLRVLFDALERTMGLAADASFVTRLYQGAATDYIRCTECGFRRERRDVFLDVSLVVDGVSTIEEALAQYVEPETLCGDNKWRCSSCQQKVEAVKGFCLESLPSVLTLQLKRFVFDHVKMCRVKLNNRIAFGEYLDMAPFLGPRPQEGCSNGHPPRLLYRLFAILMHSGTAMGENSMEAAFGGENSGCSAYMLLYRLCDPKEQSEHVAKAKPVTNGDGSLALSQKALEEACRGVKAARGALAELVPKELVEVVRQEDVAWREEQEKIEQERRRVSVYVMFSEHPAQQPHELRLTLDFGTTWGELRRLVWSDARWGSAETEKAGQNGTGAPAPMSRIQCRYALNDVRLRLFNADMGWAEETFEGRDDCSLLELGFRRSTPNTLQLEVREAGEDFPQYNPNLMPLRFKVVREPSLSDGQPGNIQEIIEDVAYARPVSMIHDVRTVAVDRTQTLGSVLSSISRLTALPADRLRLIRLMHPSNSSTRDGPERGIFEIFADRDLPLSGGAQADSAQSLLLFAPGELLFCELVRSEVGPPAHVNGSSPGGKEEVEEEEEQHEDSKNNDEDAVTVTDSPLVNAFLERLCQVTVEFNSPLAPAANGDFEDGEQPSKLPTFNLSVQLSSLSTMAQLKSRIAEVIALPVNEFRLRRSAEGNLFKNQRATLQKLGFRDRGIVFVERGAPLREGEFEVHFFHYVPPRPGQSSSKSKKKFEPLFDLPVRAKSLMSTVKASVLEHMKTLTVGGLADSGRPQYVRLREKLREKVGKIFQDDRTVVVNIPRIKDGTEIAVQLIDTPEHITAEHRCFFVQRFHPAQRQADVQEEVVMRGDQTVGELKDVLCDMSGIPRDRLGIAKGVTIHGMAIEHMAKLNFRSSKIKDADLLKRLPIQIRDGDLIVYQDHEEVPKSGAASPEALSRRGGSAARGKKRGGKGGHIGVSVYSRSAPEVALKIYTEEDVHEMELLKAAKNGEKEVQGQKEDGAHEPVQ